MSVPTLKAERFKEIEGRTDPSLETAEYDISKLILDTEAVSIWNRNHGPVFWYTAGVPGPFYVHTEYVVGGPDVANRLLKGITSILEATQDPASRARQVRDLIMDAYGENPVYQKVIDLLVAKIKKEFPKASYDLISGGERRDWFFSIPVAALLGLKHVFIFKDRRVYCDEPLVKEEAALHVADLLNNAASYCDIWLPCLEKADLKSAGQICVNSRGEEGIRRLHTVGCKFVSLNHIGIQFFEQCSANLLIGRDTLEELKTFFGSAHEWVQRYILNDKKNLDLFHFDRISGSSLDRPNHFFNADPWGLEPTHREFFAAAKERLAARG